ncbi:hypothetical protein [Acinetobacter shaoyimingii]|uniref:Uncharacterized protein n=1 Tax=Acinetobacter shaoyimingii TaxID=2715164 RepID=A0A6G8RVX2_9GAMM|nr:hypothetical protein [Acinetobacter shaoyimingii]NHB57308.1 hypothetical protein [Acinetobacter shaoyimingii]QIO06086.1 hypothetical protein G8E00_09035 [Acinetobacter shaoyimingii]
MSLKNHVVRAGNVKAIQTLHAAGLDHKVISMFMNCEGIQLQPSDVLSILKSYDLLGHQKLSNKKVQALIAAKKLVEDDDSLPCPASY